MTLSVSPAGYHRDVPTDPVGIADIAERISRPRQTVKQWNSKGWLPDPKWHASGMPLWNWPDVERHLRKTGRLKQREEGEGDG